MRKGIGLTLGAVFVALIAFLVAFMVSMRLKYPPVVDGVRRFNRSVGNPRAMSTAGQPGAYASVIRHRGRTSGAAYETPIGPFATDIGFVIPLPYGASADWVKNVLAERSAVIVNEGHTYQLERPEILSSDVAMAEIPPKYQWSLRLFNVDEFLRIRFVDPQ